MGKRIKPLFFSDGVIPGEISGKDGRPPLF